MLGLPYRPLKDLEFGARGVALIAGSGAGLVEDLRASAHPGRSRCRRGYLDRASTAVVNAGSPPIACWMRRSSSSRLVFGRTAFSPAPERSGAFGGSVAGQWEPRGSARGSACAAPIGRTGRSQDGSGLGCCGWRRLVLQRQDDVLDLSQAVLPLPALRRNGLSESGTSSVQSSMGRERDRRRRGARRPRSKGGSWPVPVISAPSRSKRRLLASASPRELEDGLRHIPLGAEEVALERADGCEGDRVVAGRQVEDRTLLPPPRPPARRPAT